MGCGWLAGTKKMKTCERKVSTYKMKNIRTMLYVKSMFRVTMPTETFEIIKPLDNNAKPGFS